MGSIYHWLDILSCFSPNIIQVNIFNVKCCLCPGQDLNLHPVIGTSPSSWRVYQFHHLGVLVTCLRSRTRYTGRLSSDFHGHLASARGNLTNDQFGSSPLNQKPLVFSPCITTLNLNCVGSWCGVKTNLQPLCAPCRARTRVVRFRDGCLTTRPMAHLMLF